MGANTDFYLERRIDNYSPDAPTLERNLLDRASAWVAGQGSDWISVRSEPGRGNTAFLQKIQAEASSYTYTLQEARLLFIDGAYGSLDQEPTRLTPIAKAVSDSITGKSSLASAALWNRFRVLATLAAGVILASCFVFIEALLKEGAHDLADLAFWQELLGNISQHPRKTFEQVVVGTVLAATFEVIAHAIRHIRSTGHSQDEQQASESRREFELNKYETSFFHELHALCRKHRGLVLLVDNSAMLPDRDKQFLEDLFAPPPGSPFAEFTRQTRLLIVTVDFGGHEWSAIPAQSVPLQLRPFTDLELQLIYSAHYPDRSMDEFKETLENARGHVSFLFDPKFLSRKIVQTFIKVEEEARTGEFGGQHMMLYWAVRGLPAIERGDLEDWLAALPSAHLAFFGLRAPKRESRKALLKQFTHSGLVHRVGRLLYFDALAVRSLRSAMKKRRPGLLAQAHFFWAAEFGARSLAQENSAAAAPSVEERELIAKQGAWHAARITVILNSPADILHDSSSKSEAAGRYREQISKLLLEAARIWRDDGDLLEAESCVSDALDWISGLGDPLEIDLVSKCADELWKNYWTGADASSRDTLAKIAEQWPPVLGRSEWFVNSRYEQFLRADISLDPMPALPTGTSPELQNLASLTATLLSIHRKHGFLVPALRDPSISIPVPVESGSSWPEAALWQLRVASINRREPDAAVASEFTAWRDRLLRSEDTASHLGRETRYQYQSARYWHLVCDVWRERSRRIEQARGENREAELAALKELCRGLALKPPGKRHVPEYSFEQAELCYRRALQFAALLRWRALIVEVSFHFGVLLLQHTPQKARTDDPPWWKSWEELFNSSVATERKLQWAFHVPAVHRLRWEFFQNVDRPTSVVDAYNTFQAVKDCGYPVSVVLDWHFKASAELNNYGDDLEDRRRSASLHEIWAHELAQLPEALEQRLFKNCLSYERAYALQFVAQAYRHTRELTRAAAALDEADALMRESVNDPSAAEEPPVLARQLRTGLRVQRAWLMKEMQDEDAAAALIFEAWRDVEPRDFHNPNLLASVVEVENRQRKLDDLWPPDGSPPFADLDNPRLSLPEAWFSGETQVSIANRFEFRLRQLVAMVTLRPEPSYDEFLFNLRREWTRLDSFGESVTAFATLAYHGGYLKTARPLMLLALTAAAVYFGDIQPDDANEIACLQLILRFAPDLSDALVLYVRVVRKHIEMIKRELAVRKPAQIDWLDLARRADSLFSVLVDSDQLGREIAGELHRRGVSPSLFPEFLKTRRQALAASRERLAAGSFEAAAAELEPHLPPKNVHFILVDDLECLDLWLRCAVKFSSHTPVFAERAAQLRDFARRHIGQYSGITREAEAQHLALELLDAIGEASRAPSPQPPSQRIPDDRPVRAAAHTV